MTGRTWRSRVLALGGCVMLTATGCAFQGLNSLPLPGAVGRGPGAQIYHVEIANVATLESNSPVMIDDVIVGSVGKLRVKDWHADVEVSVRPDIVVPANAVASVGQTSLLGSMHLALDPPLGQQPSGRLQPGTTIALSDSSTYPSTEQTLSSLSAVINSGGVTQIGDIVHNFNAALNGREGEIRDLLTRLDTFVGTLDRQRDNIIASIESLNRLAGTFAAQREVISRALRNIPPALEVLINERPRLTTALQKLGTFSATATRLVNDSQADLVSNLTNLEPVIRVLADLGPDVDRALASVSTFPYTQWFVDHGIRGDYMNLFVVVDLTRARLKRTIFLGTRWGEEGAQLVPAPGDPYQQNYTYDPLNVPLQAPPTPDGAPAPPATPPLSEPLLPIAPPQVPGAATPTTDGSTPIFAGPYPPENQSAPGEVGGR